MRNTASFVRVGPAHRSLARRFQRPGTASRVLITAAMLGVSVALTTVGVIARVDQQQTTQRLAMQRERNLQAIGIDVRPSRALPTALAQVSARTNADAR